MHDLAVRGDYVEESESLGIAGVVCLEHELKGLALDLELLALLVAAPVYARYERASASLGKGRCAEVDRELPRHSSR